ncbi:hypothetical protein H8356DRAFT_1302263 [Neocallimastix lanati (nom. inval.)]|nr:hypothetical protein H8356DRAFT_1302263 [Neocallimastix sp. JGI-2020a]
MHVRAPMQKHSIRSSSRDNSAFIKREVCVTTQIFPLALRGAAETKGWYTTEIIKKEKNFFSFDHYSIIYYKLVFVLFKLTKHLHHNSTISFLGLPLTRYSVTSDSTTIYKHYYEMQHHYFLFFDYI